MIKQEKGIYSGVKRKDNQNSNVNETENSNTRHLPEIKYCQRTPLKCSHHLKQENSVRVKWALLKTFYPRILQTLRTQKHLADKAEENKVR